MEKDQHKITEEEVQVFDKEIALADKGKKKDYFLPASIIIAALLIAGAVVFAIMYKGGSSTGGSAAQQPTATSTVDVMKVGGRDIVLGDANAPVTIIEYSDYQCPWCGKFFTETQPLIVKNYVNAGKVRMVFRNFPVLGPESTAAAEAAECAEDQNQGMAYHDALYKAKYAEETGGGSENDGSMNRAFFLKIAQGLNLDTPTFTNCIDSNKYASQVNQEKATGIAAGANSTPTFFINGQQILGALPYAQFKTGIDTLLKG
jgi:protein-disulfide isomerase